MVCGICSGCIVLGLSLAWHDYRGLVNGSFCETDVLHRLLYTLFSTLSSAVLVNIIFARNPDVMCYITTFCVCAQKTYIPC